MDHRDLSLPRFCVPLILKDKEDVLGKIILGALASYAGYQLIKITSSGWSDSGKGSVLAASAKRKRQERDIKVHTVLDEVTFFLSCLLVPIKLYIHFIQILPTKDMKDATKALVSPYLSATEISKLINAKKIRI